MYTMLTPKKLHFFFNNRLSQEKKPIVLEDSFQQKKDVIFDLCFQKKK